MISKEQLIQLKKLTTEANKCAEEIARILIPLWNTCYSVGVGEKSDLLSLELGHEIVGHGTWRRQLENFGEMLDLFLQDYDDVKDMNHTQLFEYMRKKENAGRKQ